MEYNRIQPNSDPLLLITVKRTGQRRQLERALGRIWDQPEFLIHESVTDAFTCLVERSLIGNPVLPDIFILDLEGAAGNTAAVLETARMAPGLRNTPLIALVDSENPDMRDRTYDAGADLVVSWSRLDARLGDIAGLVVGNWLNTESEDDGSRQSG